MSEPIFDTIDWPMPPGGRLSHSLDLAEDDQSISCCDAEEEVKHLRNRNADMTYRLSVEKSARLQIEIMYKAAVEHRNDTVARLRILQNENIKLQQSVNECQSLEQQLDREYDLRRRSESHAAHLTDALQLMGRILHSVLEDEGDGNWKSRSGRQY